MINKYKHKTIAILIVLGTSSTFASNVENQAQVTAQVQNSCILTKPLSLKFDYDNFNGHQVQQSMGIKCTKGSNYKVALNYGINGSEQKRRLNNTINGDLLNYQIYKRSESVVIGDGLNNTYAFEGIYSSEPELLLEMDIKVSSRQFVASGIYTDTVVASIDY